MRKQVGDTTVMMKRVTGVTGVMVVKAVRAVREAEGVVGMSMMRPAREMRLWLERVAVKLALTASTEAKEHDLTSTSSCHIQCIRFHVDAVYVPQTGTCAKSLPSYIVTIRIQDRQMAIVGR